MRRRNNRNTDLSLVAQQFAENMTLQALSNQPIGVWTTNTIGLLSPRKPITAQPVLWASPAASPRMRRETILVTAPTIEETAWFL